MLDNLPLLIALTVVVAIALGGLVSVLSRRRTRADSSADVPPPARALTPDEDLRSLGIIDIRPAQKGQRLPDAESPPGPPRVATAPVMPPPPPSLSPEGTRVRRPYFGDEPSEEDALRGGTEHLLQALHFAARAHTIGLLRQERARGVYRYVIESLYSRSAYARASGAYTTRTPLVPPGEHRPVLHRVGSTALPFEALRYYREDISALRAVLATPFEANGHTYVLVLDAKEDGRLDGPRVQDLVQATARMLAILRPAPDADAVHPDLTHPDPVPEPTPPARTPIVVAEYIRAPLPPEPAPPVTAPTPAAPVPVAAAPALPPEAPAPPPPATPLAAAPPPVEAPLPTDAPDAWDDELPEMPPAFEAPAPPVAFESPPPVETPVEMEMEDEMEPEVAVEAAPEPVSTPPPAPEVPRPAPVAIPSRRSIIAAELSRARATGLTLALVGIDDPTIEDDDLNHAEALLEARVRATAPGRRVERFADLCFGVFLLSTGPDVDEWVTQAFAHVSAGFPGRPIALGAACFEDTTLSAEQARARAENALHKSSEIGEPVVYG